MSEISFPSPAELPEWVRDIVADEYQQITPFRDSSGMWRDFNTKEPLHPTMDTSPLPTWVRQLKQIADKGELPTAKPPTQMPERRYSSRPQPHRKMRKGR